MADRFHYFGIDLRFSSVELRQLTPKFYDVQFW